MQTGHMNGRIPHSAINGDQTPQVVKDKIPIALRELSQWVLWKTVNRKGDTPTKVPFQLNGKPAKANDQTTWASFEQVWERYERGGYTGIGFEFCASDPFCGIDLDGCRNPKTGKLADWAREIVLMLATYSEVSPSETGVKLFVRAKLPYPTGKKIAIDAEKTSDKTPAIEIYDAGRYFAVTGMRLDGLSNDPEARQGELDKIVAKYLPDDTKATPGALPADFHSDDAVIDRAKKYVAKIPPAISGQGGHNRTFHVACLLVLGFALTEAEAMAVMGEYNARCQPPWTNRELMHKVQDAAKQPGERGYLRNATPARWGSITVPSYQQPAEQQLAATIAQVIHGYLRRKYDPTFRRGSAIWSNTLAREITRAEACAAPTSDIIPALTAAVDFPRGEHGPKRSAVPSTFRQWAPIAFADLLASLDDEADSPEIAESAGNAFRAAVGDALMSIEPLAYKHGPDERAEIQRRSLLDWCTLFAKPGPWRRIRSLSIWCKSSNVGLAIAIHPRLFAQIRRSGLASDYSQFKELAERYNVGIEGRTSQSRFVELTADFIGELQSGPECDGERDKECDATPHARARDDASHVQSH